MSTYCIAVAGNPNSCSIRVGKYKIRALVDSGAEVSLINRRTFNLFKQKYQLKTNHNVSLQSVGGNALNVDGYVELPFKIGGVLLKHRFYVVSNMNRRAILGRDWLEDNGVRLNFDLRCLRFNNTYVSLE